LPRIDPLRTSRRLEWYSTEFGRPQLTRMYASPTTESMIASTPRFAGPSHRASTTEAAKPRTRLEAWPRAFSTTDRESILLDIDASTPPVKLHFAAGTPPDGAPQAGRRIVTPLKAAATRLRTLAWAARGRAAPGEGLRILFYHRVSDEEDELAVRPQRFREQMAWLADSGWKAVGVGEIARFLAAGRLPERTIGLSFDDGYRDVAENALPALEEHRYSASVYVSTGVVDGRATFAWYGRQPPLLGWEEIRRLDRAGSLLFGAHTVTHPDLRALTEEQARAEIAGSKRELEEHIDREVETFCYPAGFFGKRERRLVDEAGFTAAVTTEPGTNRPEDDPLTLRRIQVDRSDTLLDFQAKVAGAFDRPLAGRGLYRRVRYRPSSRS
jgi:peptidoglycan/xylan/chitin deacetylase (PgdA/CDA1 family)